MKKKNRARSSSLFLLELIIAILFFSVASAVCVQFFVKSHTMSEQAQLMNSAVNECSSIAEIVQTADNEKEIASLVKSVYPAANVNSNGKNTNLDIYFDNNFKSCNASDAKSSYCVHANLANTDSMITCHISAKQIRSKTGISKAGDDTCIYELEVKHNAQE